MPGSKRSSVLVAALVAALLLARPAQGSSILPGNSVTPVSFAGGFSCPIGDFAAFLGPVPWSISPFLHGGYVAGVFDRDPGAGVALEFLYQVHVDGQTAACD